MQSADAKWLEPAPSTRYSKENASNAVRASCCSRSVLKSKETSRYVVPAGTGMSVPKSRPNDANVASGTHAAFGADAGVVVVVTQLFAAHVVQPELSTDHPTGSAGAVTPSKFSDLMTVIDATTPVGTVNSTYVGFVPVAEMSRRNFASIPHG